MPRDWAVAQHNLDIALFRLGECESGTGKLEEAIAAYREALKEHTPERYPLDWAGTLGNEALALMRLAERGQDATMAAAAGSQINKAVETMRNGGNARRAACCERQLTKARARVCRQRGPS